MIVHVGRLNRFNCDLSFSAQDADPTDTESTGPIVSTAAPRDSLFVLQRPANGEIDGESSMNVSD